MRSNIYTHLSWFTILLICEIWLIGTPPCYAKSSTLHHEVNLTHHEISADTILGPNNVQYLRLKSDRCYYMGETGEPCIPYALLKFAIPATSSNHKIDISSFSAIQPKDLGLPIYPVQNPQSTNYSENSSFIPVAQFSSVQPSCRIFGDYIINGKQRILAVCVPMVHVDTINHIYRKIDSLSLDISYQISASTPDWFELTTGPSSVNDIDISRFIDNPQDITPKLSGQKTQEESNKPYIILTPEYLKEELLAMVQFKKQMGFRTNIYSFEEILAGQNGRDPEEKLRNWIINENNSNGVFHLLIIGDEVAGAPIRKFYSSPHSNTQPYLNEYNGENFIPSDTYFSDVTSNFSLSLQENGYYSGSLYSQPFSPCLPVGRLLVHKKDDIHNFIKKLIIYEIDPGLGDRKYLNKAMAFFQYDMRYEKSMMPMLSDNLLYHRYDDLQLDNTFESNRPTGKEVIGAMRGCGLISMHGHGSPFTIRCSGRGSNYQEHGYISAHDSYMSGVTYHNHYLAGSGLNNIENKYKPAFAYSISCDICPFDVMDRDFTIIPDSLYNIGASFTLGKDYGGPAFIGNSRYGWITSSDNIEQEFGRFINEDPGLSIGLAFVKSGITGSNHMFSRLSRCLIGDPALKIWLGVPDLSTATVQYNPQTITISTNESESSEIIFYNGLDNPVTINANGYANKSFNLNDIYNSIGRDFTVTVLSEQKLPCINLVANNSCISGIKKTYVLDNPVITNRINALSPCFEIKNFGEIKLLCTQGVKTKNAFVVGNSGKLDIEVLRGSVELSNDTISQGGQLLIKASEVMLDSGFKVDKGAQLNCEIF